MDRIIIHGRFFRNVVFVRTHVVSVKLGYTNLTAQRAAVVGKTNAATGSAHASIDDVPLPGDPLLDDFDISKEQLQVRVRHIDGKLTGRRFAWIRLLPAAKWSSQ